MPPIVANTDRFGKACVSVRRKKSTARERIWGSLSSPCAEVIADQTLFLLLFFAVLEWEFDSGPRPSPWHFIFNISRVLPGSGSAWAEPRSAGVGGGRSGLSGDPGRCSAWAPSGGDRQVEKDALPGVRLSQCPSGKWQEGGTAELHPAFRRDKGATPDPQGTARPHKRRAGTRGNRARAPRRTRGHPASSALRGERSAVPG
jgi:hypothetical protein